MIEDSAEEKNPARSRGDLIRVRVTGEDSGGRFAVIEMVARQGLELPARVHTREGLAVCVLEGRVRFRIDGEPLHAVEERWVWLPRGCEHSYSVESQEARLLVVAVPSGFEGFYREMDERDEGSPAAPDFEWLVTLAARYGVEIAVPKSGK